jgi:polysaccharide biosynthesis/export protein
MGTGMMWRRRPEKSAKTAIHACFAMKGIDVRSPDRSAARFSRAVLACVLFSAAAITGARAQQKAPQPTPPASTPTVPAPGAARPGAQPADPAAAAGPDYVVGPGDVLQVFVWRNPELTTTVPVRPDGKISTPLVEDMVAVGKTPAQLARDVETRLAEYVRSPQVSIIITNAVSTYSQVTVVGQVKGPKSLPYREGMTVLDAVLETGGLTDFAAGNRAKLLRKDGQGKQQEIRVHLEDLVRKGRMKENVPVRPGDVLLVPESYF